MEHVCMHQRKESRRIKTPYPNLANSCQYPSISLRAPWSVLLTLPIDNP
jgi:hypothetical protein